MPNQSLVDYVEKLTVLTYRVDELEKVVNEAGNLDYKFWIPIVVSLIAIGVSLYIGYKSKKGADANQTLTLRQNLLFQEQVNLQDIKNSINIAKNNVQTLSMELAPLKSKEALLTLSPAEAAELGIKKQIFETAIEDLLNGYNDGCEKFYKNLVNQQDFMDSFHEDIGRYVESFPEKFSGPLVSFGSILKYYNEKHKRPTA